MSLIGVWGMQKKLKSILLFVSVGAALLAFAGWFYSNKAMEFEKQAAEADLDQVTGAATQTLGLQLKRVEDKLNLLIWQPSLLQSNEYLKKQSPEMVFYSRFNTVSGGQRQVISTYSSKEEVGETSKKAFQNLVNQLSLPKGGQSRWWVKKSGATGSLIYVIVPVRSGPKAFELSKKADEGKSYVVASFGLQLFAPVNAIKKGRSGELIVFNQQSEVLGFQNQSYLGGKLDKHALIIKARSDSKPTGQMVYKYKGKSHLGRYTKIPNTNLVLGVSSIEKGMTHFLSGYLVEFALVVFALIALLYFGAQQVWSSEEDEAQDLLSAVKWMITERPMGFESVQGLKKEFNDLLKELDQALQNLAPSVKVAKSQQISKDQSQKILSGLEMSIRGPLMVILAQVQIARSKAEENKSKENFTVIERELRKIRQVLDNLETSTPAGNEGVSEENIDIREVLLSVVGDHTEELKAQEIQLSKDLKQTALVEGTNKKIKSVVDQIVKNSIAALQGCENKRISLGLSTDQNIVKITIGDNGKGMDPAELERVFEPFYSTKTSEEFAGVGLTVAKGIVKSMNGSIALKSQSGKGFEAIIELPIAGTTTGLEHNKKVELSKDLDLAEPLSGTSADELPATPALDEITFIGEEIAEDFISSSAESKTIGVQVPDVKGIEDQEFSSGSVDYDIATLSTEDAADIEMLNSEQSEDVEVFTSDSFVDSSKDSFFEIEQDEDFELTVRPPEATKGTD